jgi:hypothetical protein
MQFGMPIPLRRAGHSRDVGTGHAGAKRMQGGDLALCSSIGFPENRIPLFGPML